jgi:hypothetical protein
MGTGFGLAANGLLGQGNITLSDKLSGTNSGLQRTLTQLSGGTDIINALQQSMASNPQAIQILTGTTGNIVQAPGVIGVSSPPSPTPTVSQGTNNPILNDKLMRAGKL